MTWADYTNYYRWNLPEWAYHRIRAVISGPSTP